MAYQLKSHEPIPDGIKRIVKEEFESALDRLSGENVGDFGTAVHECRKSVKKIRAVLRLFRDELGAAYSSQNTKLQAAGRKLSALRDAAVMFEVFDQLNRKFPGELSQRTVDSVRARLAARKTQVYKEAKNGNLLANVSTTLHACVNGVISWPIQTDGFPALAPGLESTFRRARKAMLQASKHPEPENFHAWRKRVKDHLYQTRLLPNLPGYSARAQRELKKLENWLGDDHNLAVFREKTSGQPGVEDLIDRYQNKLRKKALALGERVYDERPRQFTRRIKQLWDARPAAQPKPSRGKSRSAR